MKTFLNSKIAAMRAPGFVDPSSFIRAHRLHHQRGVVYPLTDRVAEPAWLRILRKFPPVGPDHAPDLVKFVQQHHLRRCLQNLRLAEFVNVFSWHSLRIAEENR